MPPQMSQSDLKKVDDIDIGAIVVSTVTSVVKNRPVTVSLWALGLLIAAFANGFPVDEATQESYSITMQHAMDVDAKQLNKAMAELQRADDKYYNAKGWFSCDDRCQKAKDKADMARADVQRIQAKKAQIMKEARKEVGIWSVFGVRDVRNSFWDAWKSGKDWAARYTMMDAMFMMIGGKEETAVSVILKLVFQYMVNLTMGLMGAFCFFLVSVYQMIGLYGEPLMSGVAFFLLVLVAGLATVGTYLFTVFGTVGAGGFYLVKQAAKQAKLQEGQRSRPRQVQYGGGGAYGGQPRYHHE